MTPQGPRTLLLSAVVNALVEGLAHVSFPPYTRWRDRHMSRERARPLPLRIARRVVPAVAVMLLVEWFRQTGAARFDDPGEARKILADEVEAARARTYVALADELPRGLRSFLPSMSESVFKEQVTGDSGTVYDVRCSLTWLDGSGSPIRVKVSVMQAGNWAGLEYRFRVSPPDRRSKAPH